MTSLSLHAQDLACRRGGRVLFRHLNLQVQAGEAWWIQGANGQGKTSLLKLLAGVSPPYHGQVRRHTPLCYVGHQSALKDDLTALESLQALARLHNLTHTHDALTRALNEMGMTGRHHTPVRQLSQGQRRRVALARLALTPSDSLWILDEPFDALDTAGIDVLCLMIRQHRQGNGAVILTSHQAMPLTDVRTLMLPSVQPH